LAFAGIAGGNSGCCLDDVSLRRTTTCRLPKRIERMRRMTDAQLARKRVLVVEDDYLVAMDLVRALERAGAQVIGPAPGVDSALSALADTVPDAAILDINLGGEMAFPVADALLERGVPFVFATGYDAQVIPPRFTHVKRCEKPMASEQICAALFGSE
jgi:ActR/RegA family two-component response regulator